MKMIGRTTSTRPYICSAALSRDFSRCKNKAKLVIRMRGYIKVIGLTSNEHFEEMLIPLCNKHRDLPTYKVVTNL